MTDIERQVSATRLSHLDNLRTLLVGWVIGGHALLGYSTTGGWAYHEVHEVSFAPLSETVLAVIFGPSALFVMGTFFFIAGLFTERAVDQHGWRHYAGRRVLRLGLPWLVSAVLLWPASVWVAYQAAGRQVSFWWVFTHREPFLDSGALWFALVLMIFSVAFAAGSAVWRRPARHRRRRPLSALDLVATLAAIAVSSFVVRLWFPARSGQPADLHLWWWPQLAGLFALGIAAARRNWGHHVPDRLRRGCGVATVLTLVLLPVLALAAGLRDVDSGLAPYLGGRHWQALATPAVEAILVVAGSVWLVGFAEHRLDRGGARSAAWARAAFAAFVIQGPVLMLLATTARLLPLPAEVKAPLVALAGVVACFWLGRHLPIGRGRRASDRARLPAAGSQPNALGTP